jgi:Peptidase family M1 domain
MNPKKILPVTFITFILLACNCKALNLPVIPHPTPSTPMQPSATLQSVTPAPLLTIPTNTAPFNIPWDDRSLFRQRLSSPYQNILGRLSGASTYHLAFKFSNPPNAVNGVEEVSYTNQEAVTLTEVEFAIFSEILGGSIKINNVLLDGRPASPIFSPGLMQIPLTVPLNPGEKALFHVDFSITIPTMGGDFYYGIFGFNEGILSLAHAYPTILVYNEQGWNNQLPDLDGDPLFSDTSFYLVLIDAPMDLTLVASGVEVSRHIADGRQQVLYADGPARDFYLAASKDYVKQSEKVGETTYNSFTPASLSQYSKSALKAAEAAVDDFSRRYAPYPYTEFTIVPIVTSAGGVEFPGMTAVAQNVYNQGNYLEIVVVHEVGHQWFYNMVGNETQQEPWLDESLAQFVTCQYFLDKYGTQAEQSCKNEMQANWDSIPDRNIPIGKPVSAYTSDGYVAIIYGRGPFFFLALRQKIGQAGFDSLMHDYSTSFAWDIATSDSFKKLAEQDCNCSLTALFQEWVNP